jgi:eukaryotic-like serine/threonine-protein kinase
MSSPAVARVDIGSLTLGRALGTGGQGSVTAVDHFLISRQWDAVLKTYAAAAAAGLLPTVLEKVVAFPRQLGPADSRWLHEHTAWPAVIVEDNGVVCGFLMRAVPAPCYFDFRTQTQGIQSRLADVAFLLNPDDYLARAGLAVDDQARLALLTAIAGTLFRLHSLGVVIGDLSPKNLLFSSGAAPRCFVIDCDTVRLHGETVLDQVDTPDWESPEGEPKGTVATDAHKFGLLAIRIFARDQSSRDESALAALSPELGRLAERSLHDDDRGFIVDPGQLGYACRASNSRANQ